MSILTKTQALLDLIRDIGNNDLYMQALDVQREIIQLHKENMQLQEKVNTKEGCYWDKNSDGG